MKNRPSDFLVSDFIINRNVISIGWIKSLFKVVYEPQRMF